MRGGREKASRKGDRGEEERPANGDCTATQKREKEGEEGRERGEKGQHTTQKLEGACEPSDVRTGGAQRSEKRRDRRAGGREGDKQTPENEHRKGAHLRANIREREARPTECFGRMEEWAEHRAMRHSAGAVDAKAFRALEARAGQVKTRNEAAGFVSALK